MATSFSDIGKSINDLLTKDLPTAVKFDFKSVPTDKKAEFKVSGAKDNKGNLSAKLEQTYKNSDGLSISHSWSTDNKIGLDVDLSDSFTKGLKLGAASGFNTNAGIDSFKLSATLKKEEFHVKTTIDAFKGPTVGLQAAAVISAIDGLIVGTDVSFDTTSTAIDKYNFALGYQHPDYYVGVFANNQLQDISVGYYHKISSDLEAGAKAVWKRSAGILGGIEFATKYKLDDINLLKTKIDQNGKLGLGFTHQLKDGFKVTVGGSFDTTKLEGGAHSVGLAFNLEA